MSGEATLFEVCRMEEGSKKGTSKYEWDGLRKVVDQGEMIQLKWIEN